MSATERWLRGPVPDVSVELQPVAHALLQAQEEISTTVAGLRPDQLTARPGGVASVAFHIFHLAGSTRRLMATARGEGLTPAEREALARERAGAFDTDVEALLEGLRASVDTALGQLRAIDPGRLSDPLEIGRMRLPSTVLGVLFHIGEHAARHAGQVVTTVKLLRSEAMS